MTKEDLFNAMDGIDEKSLVRASSDKKKIKTGSVVSGIVVAVLLCAAAFPFSKLIGVYLRGKIDFESKITEPVPTETSNNPVTTGPDETVTDETTEPLIPDDVLFRGAYFYTVDKNLGFGTKYSVADSLDVLSHILERYECVEHISDFSESDFRNGVVLIIKRLNNGYTDYALSADEAKRGKHLPDRSRDYVSISVVQNKESGPLKRHSTSILAVKLSRAEYQDFILTEGETIIKDSTYESSDALYYPKKLKLSMFDVSTNSVVRGKDTGNASGVTDSDEFAFRIASVPSSVFVFFDGSLYEFDEKEYSEEIYDDSLRDTLPVSEKCSNIYVSDIDMDGHDELIITSLSYSSYIVNVYSITDKKIILCIGEPGEYNYYVEGFSTDGKIRIRENVFGLTAGRSGVILSKSSGPEIEWESDRTGLEPAYNSKQIQTDYKLPAETSAKKAWDRLSEKGSLVTDEKWVTFDNIPDLAIARGRNGGVMISDGALFEDNLDYLQEEGIFNPNYERFFGFDSENKWYCNALYLFDFTGDGIDEFCMNVSSDPSMKSSGVLIRDVRCGWNILEMPSTEENDYYLYQGKDGLLRIKETKSGKKNVIENGSLRFEDDFLFIDWDNGVSYKYEDDFNEGDAPENMYRVVFAEWPGNNSEYVSDFVKFRKYVLPYDSYTSVNGKKYPNYLGMYEESTETILFIPEINVNSPQAKALNIEISGDIGYYIYYLNDAEDRGEFMQAYYVSSDYGNIVQVVAGSICGQLYSEYSVTKKGYYYDVVNGRKLNVKEFLDYAGISYNELKEYISNLQSYTEFFEEYEIEEADFEITSVIIDETSDDRYMIVSAYEDLNNVFAWHVNELVFTRSEVEEMKK